ncbi:transglycosylase SLT domain-containing protein [Rhodanobacter thiooxydans]|uniref:transglycosylase SLT domain-containing protein n=1 Tax=Rhodanobacter thiooxydans TaxID=416169 RepID=UPI000260DE39|nr:transglycosylase SLT domain-containing protein [Rhodanobacter thiooxydans]EIL99152.1 lytic transglycosylase catalytic subunit [Rhodanobacter thiooxydans LCS2]
MTPTVDRAKPIQLAWGMRVSTGFARGVLGLCRGFGWGPAHASWLMACMAFESATTFSPSIRNAAGSGAVGLIQFMPSTARGLGTTVENLALLSAESQLDYVAAYFEPYAKRIRSLSDMYMAILLPKYIGQPEDAVLFSGGVAYRQNAGLDANHDGKITKAEATARVADMLKRGLQPGVFATYEGAT